MKRSKKLPISEIQVPDAGEFELFEGYFGSYKNPIRQSKITTFGIRKIIEHKEIFIGIGNLSISKNIVQLNSPDYEYGELPWIHEFDKNAFIKAIDFGEYAVYDEWEEVWYVFWIA